jgi:hypothetical protein
MITRSTISVRSYNINFFGGLTYNFTQTLLNSGALDMSFGKMNFQLLLCLFIGNIKACHQLSIIFSLPKIMHRRAKLLQHTNHFVITSKRLHGNSLCIVLVATGLLQSFSNDLPIFLLLLCSFQTCGALILLTSVPFIHYLKISHVLWLIL